MTPTLGRAASLRVAYATAMQDVRRLTEENARLTAERDTATASMQKAVNILHDADLDTAQHVQLYIGERDAARTRADAAEAEIERLHPIVEAIGKRQPIHLNFMMKEWRCTLCDGGERSGGPGTDCTVLLSSRILDVTISVWHMPECPAVLAANLIKKEAAQ